MPFCTFSVCFFFFFWLIGDIYIADNAASRVCFKAEGPCNIHQHMWTTRNRSTFSLAQIPVQTGLLCVHNILHMHKLIQGSAFLHSCIPLHYEVSSIIIKTKKVEFLCNMSYALLMSVYVSSLILTVKADQPASSQGALVCLYISTAPQSAIRCRFESACPCHLS